MSNRDIHDALARVYTANPANPPLELLGFDAWLMGSEEVLKELDGFGKYFAGSEEIEPGHGWYYTGWLKKLCENRGMNGAQVGVAVADSYMDFLRE